MPSAQHSYASSCVTPEVNRAKCALARLHQSGGSAEEVAAARAALDAAMFAARAERAVARALPCIDAAQRQKLIDMLQGASR